MNLRDSMLTCNSEAGDPNGDEGQAFLKACLSA
jgi:hypothetical protein